MRSTGVAQSYGWLNGRLGRGLLVAALMFGLQPLVHADQPQSPITIKNQTILDRQTSEPLRGFHAMYQGFATDRAGMEADLRAMKEQFGLKGFTIEIGWSAIEAKRGEFEFSPAHDTLLAIAHDMGLHVNIFFTAHYTPGWVFDQGIDVRNRNEHGETAPGLWLNYAPSSPAALQWQGAFQRKAIEHFGQKPAVIGFHLTNELTYGHAHFLDYSAHAESAWSDWRAERSLDDAPMVRPAERDERPDEWRQWLLFRQDQLNRYFNTVHDQARAGLAPDNERMVFHRHHWYAASDAFMREHGLYLDPGVARGDATGGNFYGGNEVMFSMMQAWNKPIFLTETNHIGMNEPPDARPTPGTMNRMFLKQFFKGAQNQTVFRFNTEAHHPYYAMRDGPNSPSRPFEAFKDMAEVIDRIGQVHLDPRRVVGYLWPRHFTAVHGDQYWHVQQLYGEVMRQGRRFGQSPVLVYPSLLEADRLGVPPLADLELIYALRHFGLDQAKIDSPVLQGWVEKGGILVMELDSAAQPPVWLGGVTLSESGGTHFSTRADSPFGTQSGIARGGDTAWRIQGLDDVWATWDQAPGHAAVGVKHLGEGKVILIGTPSFPGTGADGFSPYHAVHSLVFKDEGLNHRFEYYRLGDNVLVLPHASGNADEPVTLPEAWLGKDNAFYLMHLDSGRFTRVDAPKRFDARFVIDLPVTHLLLCITTSP